MYNKPILTEYYASWVKPNQNLYSLTGEIINGMKPVLEEFKPDFVFVHGDTTTTMAASVAGFYSGSKVCHVEAGLRTFNKYAPFPEEINRSITGRIADFHIAPTEQSKQNLLNENIAADGILVTGNTVIDALLYGVEKVKSIDNKQIEILKNLVKTDKDLILVTGHRRENHGEGFLNICKALKEISAQNDVQIIYPVHLNPSINIPVRNNLGNIDNVFLLKPLDYIPFVYLMKYCNIIF